MARHLTLVFFISFALACSKETVGSGECQSTGDCEGGSVCESGACLLICTTQSNCPTGTLCVARGVCVTPDDGVLPQLTDIAGNNPGDSTRIQDGIRVSGLGFTDAVFEMQPVSGEAVLLAAREQSDTFAELIFPADMLSGEFVLVATNASGSTQAPVTLTLPDLTGDQLIDKLNDDTTTGVIRAERLASLDGATIVSRINASSETLAYERLPVGTTAGTVAAGDAVPTESDIEGFIANDGSAGFLPHHDGTRLSDSVIFQDAEGWIGVGTALPTGPFEVHTKPTYGLNEELDDNPALATYDDRCSCSVDDSAFGCDVGFRAEVGEPNPCYDVSSSESPNIRKYSQVSPGGLAARVNELGEFETRRRYSKTYRVSTASPAPILDFDDNPIPPNQVLKLSCAVSGTNASGAAVWLAKRWPNGTSISIENIASFGSTGSNTPQIFNNGGALSIRLYSHASVYTVRCLHELLNL